MSGIYTQGPGGAERDTTMRDLLAVLFKRKWLILGIFAVTSLAVGIKTVQSPVSFSADSTLYLNRQGARSSVLERSGRALPWVEVVESEVEVVRSTPVLQRAQARLLEPTDEFPEGIEIGLGKLNRSVKAGVIGESNVLYVTGTADRGAVAVRITNAVAEAYVEYHSELFQLPDPGGMIQARADSTFEVLAGLQEQRSAVLSEFGVTAIDDEERTLISQRERFRLDLSVLNRDIVRLETEISDARRFLQEGSITSLPFAENTGSLHGNSLMNSIRLYRLRVSELEQLRQKYTDRHPLVSEAQGKVNTIKAELDTGVAEVLGVKEHELRVGRSEAEELNRQIRSIDRRLGALPRLVQRLDSLDERIEALSEQYATLSGQVVDSQINRASYADYSVKILSPAVSADKNKKGDMVRLALGPLLALMAGIGLAFYLENLDHSLGNREDVERHLEIPVLASFPDVELEERAGDGGGGTSKIPFQKRRQG